MWRLPAMSYLVGQLTRSGNRVQTRNSIWYALENFLISKQNITKYMSTFEHKNQMMDQYPAQMMDRYPAQMMDRYPAQNTGSVQKRKIGENVSRKDKINFLVTTLLDLKDSKEGIYGALDAWVAWEQNFPIASLKQALLALEKEQQWHRVVQVIKWMLSKGQGSTMGTYLQLVRALDKDHRAEEAHKFWQKKVGSDLHSVPWQLCKTVICIYYRNNMLERLIKLFKGLEAFDRKPPEKSIVQKVADAYEMLGLSEEKERILERYKDLFTKPAKGSQKSKKVVSKKNKNSTSRDATQNSDGDTEAINDRQ